MRITEEIDQLLKKRTEAAEELHCLVCEVDEWLKNHGADFLDYEIQDYTQAGLMIYTEPVLAEKCLRRYIEEKM